MSGESGGDENLGDGKKGKRELSTSKRAAQNRAAQVRWRAHFVLQNPFFLPIVEKTKFGDDANHPVESANFWFLAY